jgi:hypothetical protein
MVPGRPATRDWLGGARDQGVKDVLWSGPAVTVHCGVYVPGSGGVAVLVDNPTEDVIASNACELRHVGRQ